MNWKIPFLDLRLDFEEKQELLDSISHVMDHGRFILGPEVELLEQRIAEYCGRRYAVGVGSGTGALFVALNAIGIGPGDEVIVPALSWIATANAVAMTGATPVFADILDDLSIDPVSVRFLINQHTRAIIPVHHTGKICDMAALQRLAEKHSLVLVEDAAQAFGSELNGNKAGSFGDIAAFSMNPVKVLGALGEAGMLLTDDQQLYEQILQFRYNGMVDRVTCVRPGLNARIDTLQASVLLKRFERVQNNISMRREIARQYQYGLGKYVITPEEHVGNRSVFYTYIIGSDNRDSLLTYLKNKGVEAMVRDPVLMPDQPAYRHYESHCPRARQLVDKLLALPLHEKMSPDDVRYVADCVEKYYREDNVVHA